MSSPPPEPAVPTPEPTAPEPVQPTTSEAAVAPAGGPPPAPGYPQPPYPYPYPYAYPPPRPTNTMAILALIFGILVPPAGIVLGHLSRKQLRERGEEGDTLALVGLVIGYVQTGLLVLFCLGYAAFIALFIGIATSTGW